MTEGTKTKQQTKQKLFRPTFHEKWGGANNKNKQTKKRKIKYGNKYNEDAASI
jgi:hypothetical protein